MSIGLTKALEDIAKVKLNLNLKDPLIRFDPMSKEMAYEDFMKAIYNAPPRPRLWQ